ncbi:uncharacterized protein LOC142353121 [Convolutriloba macropyga]|uniref:uncharacterized protein LOC142353121 n=1 Tax=Convolutriloba macropyga TaxID=536237 RepID=UPI003F52682F
MLTMRLLQLCLILLLWTVVSTRNGGSGNRDSFCALIEDQFTKATYTFSVNDLVKCIQAEYIDMEIENRLLWRPLHLTAYLGNPEASSALLQRGANPAPKNMMSSTPLHIAAYEQHNSVVKLLAQNDQIINSRDSLGNTALHMAVEAGQIDTIKILLDAKADPYVVNNRGLSPLSSACTYNNQKALDVLALYDLRCLRVVLSRVN